MTYPQTCYIYDYILNRELHHSDKHTVLLWFIENAVFLFEVLPGTSGDAYIRLKP
jgi:hypothetical protein